LGKPSSGLGVTSGAVAEPEPVPPGGETTPEGAGTAEPGADGVTLLPGGPTTPEGAPEGRGAPPELWDEIGRARDDPEGAALDSTTDAKPLPDGAMIPDGAAEPLPDGKMIPDGAAEGPRSVAEPLPEDAGTPDDTLEGRGPPSLLFEGTGTDAEGPASEDTGPDPGPELGPMALEDGALAPDDPSEGRGTPPLLFDGTGTDAEGPAASEDTGPEPGKELGAPMSDGTAEGPPSALSDGRGPLVSEAEGVTAEDAGDPPPGPEGRAEGVMLEGGGTPDETPDGRVAPPLRDFDGLAPTLLISDGEGPA